MNKREFYKYTFRLDVLSEGIFNYDSLQDIYHAITTGDCSGKFEETKVEKLNGKEMAEALIEQDSDPEFFRLNQDGEDI